MNLTLLKSPLAVLQSVTLRMHSLRFV